MSLDTEQTTLPELSLREELAANLAATIEPDTSVKTSIQDEVEVETPEQKAGRLAGRQRDEAGKLLPGKATPTINEIEPKIVTAAPRPSSWKKDYWGDWDKLSSENPKLAAYLTEREHQFASGVSTYKQEWEQAKPLIDAIAPYQPLLQQNGIDPARFVSNLAGAHQKMVQGSPQDKVAMFQQLARDYNVPVQLAVQGQDGNWQLLDQQQIQQPQPQFDPSMVSRLVQQELQQQTTKQTLEQFTRDAPTKYPHFEAVKATMAGLLQAELANDLPSAYEAALRHPRHADLFDSIQQQNREQQEAETKKVQQLKVVRARSQTVSKSHWTVSFGLFSA